MNSLYDVTQPISPIDFKGRETIITQVCSRLDNSGFLSTALVGGPYTGRSSLMRYMASEYASTKYPILSNAKTVYISGGALGSTTGPLQFWVKCFREIARQETDLGSVQALLDNILDKAQNGSLDLYDLEDFFDACAEAKLPVVLFINDFDNLLKNGNFWPPDDFFHHIRSLSQRTPRGLSFVIGTPRPIHELWDSSRGASPFYNIFFNISVGRLEEKEVKQIVLEMFADRGLEADENVEALVLKASERHPFLATYVTALCLTMMENGGEIRVENLYTEFRNPDGQVVQMIRQIRHLLLGTEKEWLNMAKTNPNALTAPQIEILRKLWDYGLVPPGVKVP